VAVFGLLSLQVLVLRQFVRVCHIVNMEWGVKENHVAVIALHNCGKSYSQIFELLKPLKISRLFIYRAIKFIKQKVGPVHAITACSSGTGIAPQNINPYRTNVENRVSS